MNFLFPHTLSWVTFFTKEILSDDALVVSMTLSMLSLRSSWGLSPPVDRVSASRGSRVSLAARWPGSRSLRAAGPGSRCFSTRRAEVGPSVHTYWASAESHRGSARVSRACRAVCWFHAPQRWLFPSVFVLCCGVLFCFLTFTVLCWFQSYNNMSEWVSGSRSVVSDSLRPHGLYSPQSPG